MSIVWGFGTFGASEDCLTGAAGAEIGFAGAGVFTTVGLAGACVATGLA
jgi:hypothetical protein